MFSCNIQCMDNYKWKCESVPTKAMQWNENDKKKKIPNVIKANILAETTAEEDVLVPKYMPFQFKMLQFLIRLFFPMAIKKGQGQSLKVVGVNLNGSCFLVASYIWLAVESAVLKTFICIYILLHDILPLILLLSLIHI